MQYRKIHARQTADFLAFLLGDVAALEKEIDEAKIALCLRQDFSPAQLFDVFDHKKIGYFTQRNAAVILDELGFEPNEEELDIFFKRYDQREKTG